MVRKIFTIGYEGATQDSFITALKWAGIGAVVDVRNHAYTAHTGFAGRELADALHRHRMDYLLLAAAQPSPLPDERDGTCRAAFHDHAEGCCALSSDCINRVAELASQKPVCLLCYEFDPHANC